MVDGPRGVDLTGGAARSGPRSGRRARPGCISFRRSDAAFAAAPEPNRNDDAWIRGIPSRKIHKLRIRQTHRAFVVRVTSPIGGNLIVCRGSPAGGASMTPATPRRITSEVMTHTVAQSGRVQLPIQHRSRRSVQDPNPPQWSGASVVRASSGYRWLGKRATKTILPTLASRVSNPSRHDAPQSR